MCDIKNILGKTRLFAGIPEEELEGLAELLELHVRYLKKGECWAASGEKLQRIGVIAKGSLMISLVTFSGDEHLMQKLQVRSVVGIDVVSTKSKINPYDIRAMEDSVLYQFNWNYIESPGVIKEEYRLAVLHNIMVLISHENMRKTYKLEILMQKGLRDRIMTYLYIQKKKKGKTTFVIPYSRDELASYLCVNRSALSHELSQMEKDGLIKYKRNEFTIL